MNPPIHPGARPAPPEAAVLGRVPARVALARVALAVLGEEACLPQQWVGAMAPSRPRTRAGGTLYRRR
eukprot:scaffold17772_cov42-Phaeocystis_antarctica.AAC.1